MFGHRWYRRALLAGLVLMAGGCGPGSMPRTHEVTGTVVYKGGAALPGGAIRFESATPSAHSSTGEIRPDGSFALTTFAAGGRATGAPEGDYVVTVTSAMNADRTMDALVVLQPKVTVKAGGANQFRIEVARPGKRR